MVNSNLKNYKIIVLQTVHVKKLARIHLLPNKRTHICVYTFVLQCYAKLPLSFQGRIRLRITVFPGKFSRMSCIIFSF